MKILAISLSLLSALNHAIAQDAEKVTLRFLSFPKNANPEPVELLVAGGQSIQVNIPTNALSEPYMADRMTAWSVGKMEPAKSDQEKPAFASYGSAPALSSANQIILLIRNGKENKDGMRVIPIDNNLRNFGGGQFFFMNAAQVDIAGVIGGTKFALKPGNYTIIEPAETKRGNDEGADGVFTEFFFRKETEARPFFSSTWPANQKARSMIFFYHDSQNMRLRMHTIRDYLP